MMQSIRGYFNGQTIELIDDVPTTEAAYVLVTFLAGSLEIAAARAGRRQVSVATYSLDRYSAALKQRMGAPPQVARAGRPFTVGEIMTRRIIAVAPNSTAAEAIRLMRLQGITSVLVEPDAEGQWGIMTMRDVLRQIVSMDRTPEEVIVGTIATRPLIYVKPELSLHDCSKLLLETNIRRAVVQERGQPVGIISDTDIFQVVEESGWGPAQPMSEEDHT